MFLNFHVISESRLALQEDVLMVLLKNGGLMGASVVQCSIAMVLTVSIYDEESCIHL